MTASTTTSSPATTARATASLADIVSRNLRQYGIMIALVAIIIVFAVSTQGRLIVPNNVWTLIQQNAYVVILALGMLLVIIAGHIDLSVGSVVAFVGGIVGYMMYAWDVPWGLAVLAGIATGVLIGAWHGFWVAYVKVPAFVVTLAGMLLFRGLAQVIAARTMAGFPAGFNAIAGGSLPNILGFLANPFAGVLPANSPFGQSFDLVTLLIGLIGIAGLVVATLRSRRSQIAHGLPVEAQRTMIIRLVVISLVILAFTGILAMNLIGGTPIVLMIVAALILVTAFITTRTVFGRHVYAVGGNRAGALLSGVNTARVDFMIFVYMGFLTGIAAIVTTSRAGAAVAMAGQSYELDAIASCFIGGAAVSGGVGRVTGVVIGALIMGVLNMGLSILNVNANWTMAIKGLVLLAAVAFDLVSKRRGAGA
ncbi:MAG: sugar ABC transporter permease [Propionibacteriaceae bacterium]|jgi:putative multiple sugar transport system permease protein|nr:sugar ABC transporter permease [Propionibacteriaceae bacterium]